MPKIASKLGFYRHSSQTSNPKAPDALPTLPNKHCTDGQEANNIYAPKETYVQLNKRATSAQVLMLGGANGLSRAGGYDLHGQRTKRDGVERIL